MSDQPLGGAQPAQEEKRWRPVSATDRRVLGVLIEKAKTTPDAYPMTVNGLRTGCNQKTNRYPLMELETEDIEESLERLRGMGAVGMIEGASRVDKFRHYLYEWLGVDKVEVAVMAELLLRGAQTVGELRTRASRMEPIADLTVLKGLLDSLISKGLVISLTPEGRGQVVTHALYQPRELEKLREEFARMRPAESEPDGPAAAAAVAPRPTVSAPRTAAPGELDTLRQEVAQLRSLVAELRGEIESLGERLSQTEDEFRRLREDLGA